MSQYLRGQWKGFIALVGSVVSVDTVVLVVGSVVDVDVVVLPVGLDADTVVVLPVGLDADADTVVVQVGENSAEPMVVVLVACVIGAGIN